MTEGHARALPPPQLDASVVPAGSVTTAVSGWDPAAPRRLTLWRVEGGRFALLAETRSAPDGRFRFPEIAAGDRELATGAGDEEPNADAPHLRLSAPAPEAPAAQAIGAAEGDVRLRVWPSASATAVVFAAAGREIGRRVVSGLPAARERMLEVPVVPGSYGASVYVAEERAGGARSPWRRIDLDSPDEDSGVDPSLSRRP